MGSLPQGQGYLLIGAILLILFSLGCTGLFPAGGDHKTIQVSSEIKDGINLPFSDAADQFRMITGESGQFSSYQLHSIRGIQVDKNGDARSWVFGVSSGSDNKLIVFSRGASPDIQQWPGTLPGAVIPLDDIIPPQDLFSRRAALIKGMIPDPNTAETTLELTGNIYSLTVINKGATSTYRFVAKSGELIPSP